MALESPALFVHSTFFYAATPALTRDDFYNHDTTEDIEIAVTFTDLTPSEMKRFSARVQGEDLPVVRVLSMVSKNSGKYFGVTPQFPEFAPIRSLSGRDQINFYREFRKSDEYKDALPTATSGAAIAEALTGWEAANAGRLELGRDDGQFFGFENVGRGYLSNTTKFIFIPAVRDAADDVRESKSSPITQLMDLVVRAALATSKEIAALKASTQQEYEKLTSPDNLPALAGLAGNLTGTLRQYYDNTDVKLRWQAPDEVALPPPKADVRLSEDELDIPVSKVGHGLQRAFILSLLQHLAVVRSSLPDQVADEIEALNDEPDSQLNLILGIEEPELYQHPNRQRHFSRVLLELSQGRIAGVAARTQVIYATHSPLLVGIDRFDNVRRITRHQEIEGTPKRSVAVQATWDGVAEIVWQANGSPQPKYTADSIRARVATLMTPWVSEGFFADVAVLVEGEDDRAALLGAAFAREIDLESEGCAIIPCNGKSNLDRARSIFEGLGIPTYILWDSDHGLSASGEADKINQAKSLNAVLLRLVGHDVEDWPSKVSESFACFKDKLEVTMRAEIGPELFDDLLQKAQGTYQIAKRKHALKSPLAIADVLRAASAANKESATLNEIISMILDRKVARPVSAT